MMMGTGKPLSSRQTPEAVDKFPVIELEVPREHLEKCSV